MGESAFDLDRLRLSGYPAPKPRVSQKPLVRRPRSAPFLKGPIPIPWLWAAGRLPGKALAIGIEIWFQAGLNRSQTVAINLSRFRQRGISRWAASRGLAALEVMGLVSVTRHPGRKPLVRIIAVLQETDGVDRSALGDSRLERGELVCSTHDDASERASQMTIERPKDQQPTR